MLRRRTRQDPPPVRRTAAKAELAACSATLVALSLASGIALAQAIPTAAPAADTIRLTIADARQRALHGNADLRAARLSMSVARGELRQASLYLRSNPTADVLTRGEGAEVGITQEIEIAGQRGARRAAGLAGADRARAGVMDAARLTLGEVERAFYRLAAAQNRVKLAAEVVGLNERLADAASRQLAAGDISQLEYNLAAVEVGRSRSRLLAAQRRFAEAASELRPLTGIVPPTGIVPIVEQPHGVGSAESSSVALRAGARQDTSSASWAVRVSLNVDSLTALALARRPDLLERAAAARQSHAQASVARRDAFPNLALRVSSERVDAAGGRVLRPGIGITLPAFNWNQGEVEARRAEAAQAELERGGLVVRIRSDIARAVTSYESALAETEILEGTVLTPARDNRRLLEVAYQAGKIGLPVLLLIRNQVIDAELEYWDAWLAEREALVDLAELTGENIQANARAVLGEGQ